jgi:hypothetical protein
MRTLNPGERKRIREAFLGGSSVKDVSLRFGFSVMFLRRHNLIPENPEKVQWTQKRSPRTKRYRGDSWRGFQFWT